MKNMLFVDTKDEEEIIVCRLKNNLQIGPIDVSQHIFFIIIILFNIGIKR